MAAEEVELDIELKGISTDHWEEHRRRMRKIGVNYDDYYEIDPYYWDDLRKQRAQQAKPSAIGIYSTAAFSIQNTVLFLQSILVSLVKLGVIAIPWLYTLLVVVSFIQSIMLLITNFRSYWNLFSELRSESSNFIKNFLNKFKRLKGFTQCCAEERKEIIGDILNELLVINVVIYKTLGSAVATKGFLDSHVNSVDNAISQVTFGHIAHGGNVVNNTLVAISTPGVAIAQYSVFSRVNDRQHNYRVTKLLEDTQDESLKNAEDPSTKFSFKLVLCHFFAFSYGILDALLYSEALFRAASAHGLFSALTPYTSPLFWVLAVETIILGYGNYKSYLGLMKNFFFNPGPGDNLVIQEKSTLDKVKTGVSQTININSAIFKTIGSGLSAFIGIGRYLNGSLPAMIIAGILVVICSIGVLFSNLALFAYAPMRKMRVNNLLADTAKVNSWAKDAEFEPVLEDKTLSYA